MKLYMTVIIDKKLSVGNCRRVSFVQGETGKDKLSCSSCGKVIRNITNQDNIIAIFCCDKCAKKSKDSFLPKLPEIIVSPFKVKVSRKLLRCLECGGVSKRKGFVHTKDCKDNPANIHKIEVEKRRSARGTCPDCGGEPGTRRGFRHKSTCTRIAKPVTQVCSGCGGKKRGRGFSHFPGCKLKK